MTAKIEQRWNDNGEESWCIISGDLIIPFGPGASGKGSAERVIARGDDPSGYNNCPEYTLTAWQNAAESLPAACADCGQPLAGCACPLPPVAEPKPTPSTLDTLCLNCKRAKREHRGTIYLWCKENSADLFKSQPDSSSIPDEMRVARSKWWDELLKAEGMITIGETFRAFEAGWNAAKGQR